MSPFRTLQFANELSQLTITFRSALVDAQRKHPGADAVTLAQVVANSPDVRSMWAEAADFPRRDYMTFCAEHAFRAGVSGDTLWAGGDTAAVQHAAGLVELVAEQLNGAPDPSASLLPDNPASVAVGPVGCYAVSVVCDSTEPEPDKILACALLNAYAEAGK